MLWQLVLVTSNNSASGGQLNKQTGILRQEVTGITLFGCASSRGNLSQRVTVHQGLCCSFAHMCMLSCSVVSDSLQPHGLYPTRLLCPWNSPDNNTGVCCHPLLQGIFPTQGWNLGLLHCRQILTRMFLSCTNCTKPRPIVLILSVTAPL